MGNCSIKGGTTGECHHSIRVLSDTGVILQFKAPITVGQVLQHHPGYGVFLQGHASSSMPENESLSYGFLYYLLPLNKVQVDPKSSCSDGVSDGIRPSPNSKTLLQRSEVGWKGEDENDEGARKSPQVAVSEYVENLSNGSALEVLPSAKNGVWRVKLVIDTRQLEEILSEQVNTEALIEKMRMAATACSASPARSSRTMSTWKLGWKPTLFSAKSCKSITDAGSNLDLGTV